jgi:hypothetical protein
VNSVGDLDGDGLDDFALTNATLGARGIELDAFLVTSYVEGTADPGDVGVTVHYDRDRSPATIIVSDLGDVNADGYGDVAVGESSPFPSISVLEGPFGTDSDLDLSDSPLAFTTSSSPAETGLVGAANLGDWNGDGGSVLAIFDVGFFPVADGLEGFFVEFPQQCAFGAAYLIAGPFADGVREVTTDADRIEGEYVRGNLAASPFGAAWDAGSDLNDDGAPDLVMGSWTSTTAHTEGGAAYVLFGETGH